MKIKLALITIACAITSCSSSQAQPNSEATNIQLSTEASAPAVMAVSPVTEAVVPANEVSKSSIDAVNKYQCNSTKNHLFLILII